MSVSGESSPKLADVTGRESADSMYTARWSDGRSSRYPFVWLWDNCRCLACYQPSSHQRLLLMRTLDPDIKPINEEITDDGALLKVTWPNRHVGEYPSSWLRQQQFDGGHCDPLLPIRLRPWGTELGNEITQLEYNDVMEKDDALFAWLHTLCEVGFALITNAPTEAGIVEALANRVAYLRPSRIGKTFHVHTGSRPDHGSSAAYSDGELGAHVDLPCNYYVPGMQILHCIRQTAVEGGNSQLFDGYNAAMILKRDHPGSYELLKTTKINFGYRFRGSDDWTDWHSLATMPVIEEDDEGDFKRVTYSNHMRTPDMDLPVEKVQDFFRALKILHDILYENRTEVKLKEGDIATIDNRRVMHGRVGFKPDPKAGVEGKERHLEGGYIGWDEIHSRMRVLKEKRGYGPTLNNGSTGRGEK